MAEVEALADACKAAGFGRNLSFASKAINMLGQPAPLFSSECTAFLQLKGGASGGYDQYCKKWRAAFEVRAIEYRAAATEQLAGSAYRAGAADGAAQRAASKLAVQLGHEWFAIRGFDVHLLAVGGPMRK